MGLLAAMVVPVVVYTRGDGYVVYGGARACTRAGNYTRVSGQILSSLCIRGGGCTRDSGCLRGDGCG